MTQIRQLLQQQRPILGICLGHQLLGLACGAKTERMTYGHRSYNQPVIVPGEKHGHITSQNHSHRIVENSWDPEFENWFININDGTVEGIRHKTKPFWGVQFHPESSGGPRDTGWIFHKFMDEVKKYANQ